MEIFWFTGSFFLKTRSNLFHILETFYCFFVAEVLKQLQVFNEKLDVILRYLAQNSNNSSIPVITNTIEVQASNLDQLITADQQPTSNEGIILDGFPPSYSMIQAAKEPTTRVLCFNFILKTSPATF